MKDSINSYRLFLFAVLVLAGASLISANIFFFIGRRPDILHGTIKSRKGKAAVQDKGAANGKDATDKKGGKGGKDEEKETPGVKVYKVGVAPFVDVLHCSGHVVGSSTTELRFEVSGIVRKFNFKEGDLVKAGDVVAELDSYDSELKVKFREAKLKAAQTTLLSAKKKLQMHEDLFKIGAIIQAKLDEVKFEYQNAAQEYDSAKIELASSKSELAKTKLIAPKNAVLASRDVETGEYVTSSTKVTGLVDIETIAIDFGIIEKQIDRVATQQDIVAKVDSYPDKTFNGKIERVSPTIDPHTGMLTVRCKVKNLDNLLLPGMFATVDIVVYSKNDALLVPRDAITLAEGGGGYTTWVVGEENTVSQVRLDVEYDKNPDQAVIRGGLKQGDKVVVAESQYGLKDKMKVEIVEEKGGQAEKEGAGQSPEGSTPKPGGAAAPAAAQPKGPV